MTTFRETAVRRAVWLAGLASLGAGLMGLASCASDEPGHTKTTTKTTVDTPTERTTTTETHEKDTRYVPRN